MRCSNRRSTLLVLIAGLLIAAPVLPSNLFARDPASDQDPKTPPAKEVVDYAKLKALLPDTVAGIKRSKAEGSKQGMAAMKISQATGTYSEEGKTVNATINIMDYGAVPGMIEGMSGWMNMDVDNDSDTDASKTLTVNGYKAFEEFSKTNKSGHILVVVGKRFWVEIKIDGVDMDALKTAAEAMDLKGLEALDK